MKSCPVCRAANLASAVVCVSCGATLGEVPLPGPLQQTPPEIPPDPAAIEAAKARQTRRATIAAVAIGVALVIGIGLLVFALNRGDGFPDEIDGKPRITSEEAAEVEDLFESQEIQGLSMEIALYGTGDEPSVIVMVLNGMDDAFGAASGSEAFWQSFGKGFAQGFAATSGGSVVSGKPLTREIDGVRYFCVGVAGVAGDGSLCMFLDEEVGLLLSTTYEDPADTIRLAEEAAAAL